MNKLEFGRLANGRLWGELLAAAALFVVAVLVYGLYNYLTYCR